MLLMIGLFISVTNVVGLTLMKVNMNKIRSLKERSYELVKTTEYHQRLCVDISKRCFYNFITNRRIRLDQHSYIAVTFRKYVLYR